MAEPFLAMRFEGAEELATLLDTMPDAVSRRAQLRVLRKAAGPMRLEMARAAPRGNAATRKRSIRLANSITIQVIRDRTGEGEAKVAVGPTKEAFWGFFQELGTIHHPPQSFARPAFDSRTGVTFAIMQDGYWGLLEKWLRRKGQTRKRQSR